MSENLRDRYAEAIHAANCRKDCRIGVSGVHERAADAVLAVHDDVLAEKDADTRRAIDHYVGALGIEKRRREAAEAEVARLSALQSVACQGCGADAEACAAAEPKCCPDCWPLNMHRAFADGIRAQAREARLRETGAVVAAKAKKVRQYANREFALDLAAAALDAFDAALAPRESATEAPGWCAESGHRFGAEMVVREDPDFVMPSATEAPRTRDGEQGGER